MIINPKGLSMLTIKHVADAGVPIEVAGREPSLPRTYEDRRKLRQMTGRIVGNPMPDGRGRPKVYEIADTHIQAAIVDWHAGAYVDGRWRSTYTPSDVMERARLRTGLSDLPKHWARNVVIAEFGSAVRNPDDLLKKAK